jgi:hypothetical protein
MKDETIFHPWMKDLAMKDEKTFQDTSNNRRSRSILAINNGLWALTQAHVQSIAKKSVHIYLCR